jgi:hypothetical protein
VAALALGLVAPPLSAQGPRLAASAVGVRAADAVAAGRLAPDSMLSDTPQRRHTGRGAIIGAIAGGATLLVGIEVCERQRTNTDGPPCAIAISILPAFIAGGAIIGAVIGYLIPAGSSSPPGS